MARMTKGLMIGAIPESRVGGAGNGYFVVYIGGKLAAARGCAYRVAHKVSLPVAPPAATITALR